MATGGASSNFLPNPKCCVCLEGLFGRSPKFLPCHHTVCSPCLEQLVQAVDAQNKVKSVKKELKNEETNLIFKTSKLKIYYSVLAFEVVRLL